MSTALSIYPYYDTPNEQDAASRAVTQLEIPTILFRWEEWTKRKLDAQPLLAFAELWRCLDYRPGIIEVNLGSLAKCLGRTEASARRWIAGILEAGIGARIDSRRGPHGGVLMELFDPLAVAVEWRVIEPDGQLLLTFASQSSQNFVGTDGQPPPNSSEPTKYVGTDEMIVDGTDEIGAEDSRRSLLQEYVAKQRLAEQNKRQNGERHGVCDNINNVLNLPNVKENHPNEISVAAGPLRGRFPPQMSDVILSRHDWLSHNLKNRRGLFRWTSLGVTLLQTTPAFHAGGRPVRLSECDVADSLEASNSRGAGTPYFLGCIRQKIRDALDAPADTPVRLPQMAAVRSVARDAGLPWSHKWMCQPHT